MGTEFGDIIFVVVLAVILLLVSIVSSIFESKRYENCEKTDRGFQLMYRKLSYRRKFIRTMWTGPVITVLGLAIIWAVSKSVINITVMAVLFVVVFAWQAVYNYRKWKQEERER